MISFVPDSNVKNKTHQKITTPAFRKPKNVGLREYMFSIRESVFRSLYFYSLRRSQNSGFPKRLIRFSPAEIYVAWRTRSASELYVPTRIYIYMYIHAHIYNNIDTCMVRLGARLDGEKTLFALISDRKRYSDFPEYILCTAGPAPLNERAKRVRRAYRRGGQGRVRDCSTHCHHPRCTIIIIIIIK